MRLEDGQKSFALVVDFKISMALIPADSPEYPGIVRLIQGISCLTFDSRIVFILNSCDGHPHELPKEYGQCDNHHQDDGRWNAVHEKFACGELF